MTTSDDMMQLAAVLSPHTVMQVSEVNKGGNSRIYRVSTAQGYYALKRYPAPSMADRRDRLQIETLALQTMWQHGVRSIPEVVAVDVAKSATLLSWVAGVAMDAVSDADIDVFADFLEALAGISERAREAGLPPASEACVSAAIIGDQIERRLKKLQEVSAQHAGLKTFLDGAFSDYLCRANTRAEQFYRAQQWSLSEPLATALQVLIPSDFGSHNALRQGDRLVFLDFEYFGWDDPVTSTANFILHPAMRLSPAQKAHFCARMCSVFASSDALYAARFDALLPLYAARWACIILNEFIPERFAHRVASGHYRVVDKEQILTRQLQKAMALLASVPVEAGTSFAVA